MVDKRDVMLYVTSRVRIYGSQYISLLKQSNNGTIV